MSGDAADEALIKGGAIRELLLWYERNFGHDYARAVGPRLPPHLESRVFAEKPALGLYANVWYPSPIVHAILDSMAERHAPAELREIMAEANGYAVRSLTRGVYQFLFRMVGSPELYAKHIQRAWNLLHSTGRRVIVLDDGVADSTIEDWPGHHPWLCEITTHTMQAVFVAMGCRDVSLERVACISQGAPNCRSLLYYRDR
jgi:hypothetical protein